MAEELVMTIKSNIKGVTKDTEALNNTLSEQKQILLELQKEEIALQQKRANMTAYERSLSGIDKQLEHINLSIKDQKLAVKGLTEEQKEATGQQKIYNQEIKKQDDAIKGTIGNFQVFGVSINGIRKSVGQIIPLIRTMFKTFTRGLMSTGIGAFVIAFGTLVTYVTSTKEGMDKLNVVTSKLGAAFKVIRDRIANVGKELSEVFNQGIMTTLRNISGLFGGISEEMSKEVKIAGELTVAMQQLRDKENEFLIQKVKTRLEIEKARLLSEDETTSAQVRLSALRKALDLEIETSNTEIDLAKERKRIFEEDMVTAHNKAEAEAELARLSADISQKEIASLRLRKRVMTEVNEMENKITSERKNQLEKMPAITADINDKLILANNSYLDSYLATNNAIKKSDDAVLQNKLKVTSAIGGAVGALSGLLEEGSSAAKAAALAEIAINTGVGLVQGLDIAQKSAKATGPGAAIAFPLFYATQVAAVLGAAAQAKQILGAGGGGVTPPSTTTPSAQTPAPQMMSGAFELTGGVAPEAMRAYVVTDEMTNSQNQLANIRRRATI